MATSFTFNPFTSTFDVISTVTLAAVGSTPNANGASISGQTLTLQPADATNPGLLTASTQFIGGDKYFSTSLQVNGTALTTTAVGATSKLILVGSFITSVSYSGSTPTVIGYKANGSEAVPTATTANQIINAITGRGHDGTNFSAGTRGRFCIHSSEVYASGAQGTYLTMSTTLTGTTTLSERMRIFDNGNVSIGNTTSTAKLSVTGDITASTTITATGNMAAANLSGTNTGDQTITLTGDVTGTGTGSFAATIANNAVTNAKSAQMAAHTFKGNNTGSTANAADLTATQLTAELNQFTSGLQGVVPSSGGGTANYLRADGSWASPAASSAIVARATSSVGQTINTSTHTPLNCNAVPIDTNSAFTTGAASLFTAPVTGYYRISGCARFDGVTAIGNFILGVSKNGTLISNGMAYINKIDTTSQILMLTGSDVVSLTAADTVIMTVYQDAAGSMTLNASALYNYFTVNLV